MVIKANTEMELTEVTQEVGVLAPEHFIGTNEEVASKCLQLLKLLYDFSKKEETESPKLISHVLDRKKKKTGKKQRKSEKNVISSTEAPLKNLIVDNFDQEQIWEELQLQNNFIQDNLVTSVSKLLTHQRYSKQNEVANKNVDSGKGRKGIESGEKFVDKLKKQVHFDDDDDEEDESGDEDLNEQNKIDLSKITLDDEEEEEGEDDDEFGDEKDDDQGQEKRYNLEEEEDEEDDDELEAEEKQQGLDEEPSNFEKRRRKIEENIELIEEEALKPKDWKYQGEVTAQTRPENSLLEEHLIFDHLIRQAPEITTKTTLRLEDIIKQRVKDQAWDDVQRKIKPIDDPNEFKKKLVLDAEKSKASLAEIYEQEYIKKKKAEDGEAGEEESVPPEQIQIQKDMQSLFSKLDALSNFHYTPKPPSVEIKVVSNLPSITMEEVAPLTVSDATLLAPQEVQSQDKGAVKSKEERTDTDRKRERRLKKKKQKFKRLAQEEKARLKGLTGLRDIKLTDNIIKKHKKKGDLTEGNNDNYQNSKELKSSKAFFAKLQTQVHSQIKNVKRKDQEKTESTQLSAKKFKL